MNKTAKILIMAVMTVMLGMLAGCGPKANIPAATPSPSVTPKADPTIDPSLTKDIVNIMIEMQDGGKIKAELYPDIAPITVANFVKLVNEHFYDGLIFHRVIPGFMIQGGGYDTNNEQKQADTIEGEFASNGVTNDLKHTRGVLSMARTPAYNSASSQFFIMHADTKSLDGEYAAFGKVTEGMDVVDRIANTQTTTVGQMQNYPASPQVIKTIIIDD